MEDRTILSQLIKDTACVRLEDEYGKSLVTLREPQAKDSSVTIRNVPSDAVVLNVDTFKSPDTIFNCDNGECKRADFVIISQEQKCIVYIELKRKKDKGGWKQVVQQLIGAECFIKYCREVGRSFWEEQDFLSGYIHRFISIGHTSLPKRKTRIDRKASRHDSPEKAMKIDWPNYLQFNQLVGARK